MKVVGKLLSFLSVLSLGCAFLVGDPFPAGRQPCFAPLFLGEASSTSASTIDAKALRDAVLTNHIGDSVRLGDRMGNSVSLVIFLRHLG